MVINQFHPIVGGAERQAQKLAKGLIERGVDVEVLTSRRRGWKKRELVDGVPVRRHRVFYIPLGRRKFGYTLFYVAQVFLYLLWHRKSFDILHTHQAMYPAFVASLAARLLRKPSIVKSASSGTDFDLVKLQRKPLIGPIMVRSMCKNTDWFIAISRHIRGDLARFGVAPHKIVFLPNGVEMPHGRPNPAPSRNAPPRMVAGFIGILSQRKNLETVLRAWADLPVPLRDDCRLLIVGDGPERGRLEAFARDLGIAQNTAFCGHQDDASSWLARMDCYVSMSFAEGLSNSLLEAMAHAKACIVSDGVSGNVDLIQDGENGFLVAPTDHTRLAELLAMLAGNRELLCQLGEKASRAVAQQCAMPMIVDRYIALYQEAASPGEAQTSRIKSIPATQSHRSDAERLLGPGRPVKQLYKDSRKL
jgi:L-malate glycosyltransferase